MIAEEPAQKQPEEIENRFDSSNPPDAEVELGENLDEEIHQVIFKGALNDAVMNLALKGGNDGLDSSSQESKDIGFSSSINVEAEGDDAKDEAGENENEGAEEQEYTNEQGRNEDAGNGGGSWRQGGRNNIYPVRPGAEDCAYYMRTGNCKFGATCKFNHSPRKKIQGKKEKQTRRVDDLVQPGQTECKFYLAPGGCKYGKACKYNHSRERSAVAPVLEFNFHGLPIRLGEKECPYYMRHGSCKYGSSCKFNHPHPTSAFSTEPTQSYGNGGSVHFESSAKSPSSWSVAPMLLPANQHLPLSNPDWNGYAQAQVYPTPEISLPTPPAFAVNNPAAEASIFARQQQQMPADDYPERPGHPECSYFLKTGDCKYKSNCRFHHPKTRVSNSTSCVLSAKGLPLRPDQTICSFYNRYGICKFGPSCKFDHPENCSESASSDGTRMARQEMEANVS